MADGLSHPRVLPVSATTARLALRLDSHRPHVHRGQIFGPIAARRLGTEVVLSLYVLPSANRRARSLNRTGATLRRISWVADCLLRVARTASTPATILIITINQRIHAEHWQSLASIVYSAVPQS